MTELTRKSKKRLVLGIVGFLLIMQIAAKNNSDAIVQILNETENAVIREKLLVFHREGVERPIQDGNLDIEGIIGYAESLIGTPHRMGGTAPSGLDCSGLVMLAHSKFNVSLPHSSQEQARYGTIIAPGEELKRGDLVFFHSTYSTNRLVTHSGIYVGEGRFIHTSSSKGVTVSDFIKPGGYWQKHYLFATRLGN